MAATLHVFLVRGEQGHIQRLVKRRLVAAPSYSLGKLPANTALPATGALMLRSARSGFLA